MLHSRNLDSFSPIAFILAGPTAMLTRLKSLAFASLRRRIEAYYCLEGLDEEERKAYIEQQLAVAGGKHPIFPPDILTMIFEHSKGVPSTITRLCTNCLLDALSKKK